VLLHDIVEIFIGDFSAQFKHGFFDIFTSYLVVAVDIELFVERCELLMSHYLLDG